MVFGNMKEPDKKCLRGLAFGRFQPLHIGHIEHLTAAFDNCEKLFIGITNPDPNNFYNTELSSHRSLPEANPFTYFDRFEMIENSLIDLKIQRNAFEIIPIFLNNMDYVHHYIPRDTIVFISVFEKWGYEKVEIFKSKGYSVKIIHDKSTSKKLTSGSEIRSMIGKNHNWTPLVPKAVVNLILNQNLDIEYSKKLKNAVLGDGYLI